MKKSYLACATFAMLVLTGCGGGGSGSSSSTSSSQMTGTFIDSEVSGLKYECSSGFKGITDKDGKFSCNTGDTITFYINGLKLGSSSVQETITPKTLAPNDEKTMLNIAQLLQTLDSDNNVSNGITLDIKSQEIDSLKDTKISVSQADFDSVVTSYIGKVLVDETTAKQHFEDSLSKLKKVSIPTETHKNKTVKYEYMTQEEYDALTQQGVITKDNEHFQNYTAIAYDANITEIFNSLKHYTPLQETTYYVEEFEMTRFDGYYIAFYGMNLSIEGKLKMPRTHYYINRDEINGPVKDGYNGIGTYTITEKYLDYDGEKLKFSKLINYEILNQIYSYTNFTDGDVAQCVYSIDYLAGNYYLYADMYFNQSALQKIITYTSKLDYPW